MSARRQRAVLPTAAAALLGACAAAPASLQQFGGMREVMRDGHVEARVRLADLELANDTIAVGALTGLAGEVTIAGDAVHLATAPNGLFVALAEPARADAAATLLTIATPDRVVETTAAAALDERALAELARATNLPGVRTLDLAGTATRLDLHVARGACPHGVTTPATEPWRWSAPSGRQVRLIGFFAPGEAGVMTHHGTEFHLHAIVRDGARTISGHVDAFALAPGAIVKIGGTTR